MIRCKLYRNLTWASPASAASTCWVWFCLSRSNGDSGLMLTTATTMVRSHQPVALRGGNTV
jgi:hypothetical protein